MMREAKHQPWKPPNPLLKFCPGLGPPDHCALGGCWPRPYPPALWGPL